MLKDLTGQRFGRLTVARSTDQRERRNVVYECSCDCGNACYISSRNLLSGHTTSCGCRQKETQMKKKHGESTTRLYGIWRNMKYRCQNVKSKDFANYGGRGISVCSEWKSSYEAFRDWALANGYQECLSIDRIDPNGNYCPENCRWITMEAQHGNIRNNVVVEIGCEKHTIAEWCRLLNMPQKSVRTRIHRGMAPDKALTTPIKQRPGIEIVKDIERKSWER